MDFGPVSTNVEGSVAKPLITSGSNVVLTAVFGGTINDLRVKLPPMSSLTHQQVADQTYLAVNQRGRPYLYELATDELIQVGSATTSLAPDSYPQISPDGTRMLNTEVVDGSTPSFQIFISNLDGSNRVQLTSGSQSNALATFSHDGTKIVFARYSSDFSVTRIMKMNVDGTNQVPLTQGFFDITPSFNFDNSKIIWCRHPVGANGEIWWMNADGSNKQKISLDSPDINYTTCTASPLGNNIAVAYSDSLGGGSVAHMSPNNSPSVVASVATGSFLIPNFSPDEGMMAFTRQNTDGTYTQCTAGTTSVNQVVDKFTQAGPPDGQWGPYIADHKFIGTASSPFGASVGGFIFSLQNEIVPSLVAFDSPTRSGITVEKQDDQQPGQPDVLLSIETGDKLNSLQYVNAMNNPPIKVILPGTGSTHASGALVAFSATTGRVVAVVPYTSSAQAKMSQMVTHTGDREVAHGKFKGVWDANGKNLAPGGASEVVINARTGDLISFR